MQGWGAFSSTGCRVELVFLIPFSGTAATGFDWTGFAFLLSERKQDGNQRCTSRSHVYEKGFHTLVRLTGTARV